MKKVICTLLLAGLVICAQHMASAEPMVIFDFEGDLQGWEIPDWAYEQDDYVGKTIDISNDFASNGKSSLVMTVDFKGGAWRGAVAEVMQYMDWTKYSSVSCDVLIPQDGPEGLRAKIVLTVGDNWKWTEMSRAIKLTPGTWTTISANLLPGSMDWKRTNPSDAFRADVRKIDIRVESNRRPAYTGPVYIDNIVIR